MGSLLKARFAAVSVHRVWGMVGLLLLLGLFDTSPLEGQIQRTVGFHLGQVRSKQIWEDPVTGGRADGLTLGIQLDVPTPARFLAIRAGAEYVQRGGVVWDQSQDPDREFPANVRTHYLSLPVQGTLRLSMGPGGAYLLFGPTMDLLLNTQCPQDFCRLLADERPTVLSATVGAGVFVEVRARVRVELEARLTEGLTAAYVSNSGAVRYRSLEILLRASVPF